MLLVGLFLIFCFIYAYVKYRRWYDAQLKYENSLSEYKTIVELMNRKD